MSVRFQGILDIFGPWILGLSFFVAWGVALIVDHKIGEYFFILWPLIWSGFVGGAIRLNIIAEFVVSDVGIERKCFGWTCLRIRWSDMKAVREYTFNSAADKTKYSAIKFSRKHLPFSEFQLARTTIVQEKYTDQFDELVDLLNKYITMHAIRVELYRSGQWEPTRRLVTTLT